MLFPVGGGPAGVVEFAAPRLNLFEAGVAAAAWLKPKPAPDGAVPVLAPAPKSEGFAALPLSVPVVPLLSVFPKENADFGCDAPAAALFPKRLVPEEGAAAAPLPKRLDPLVAAAPKRGFAGVVVPVVDVLVVFPNRLEPVEPEAAPPPKRDG